MSGDRGSGTGLRNPGGSGMDQTGTAAAIEAPPSEGHLSNVVTEADIDALFRIFLKHPVDEQYARTLAARGVKLRDVICDLKNSEAFALIHTFELGVPYTRQMIDRLNYRTPTDLQRCSNRESKRPVLLIGSCLMDPWPNWLQDNPDGYTFDRLIFNNASRLPDVARDYVQRYAFQICQIPLRSVLEEGIYFGLRYDDRSAYEEFFDLCKTRLNTNFDQITRYNTEFGIETYILNFVTPIQNPIGRLQNRYDLRNLVFFLEELNRHLYSLLETKHNCHLVDFDQIIATFGKKYYSDEIICHFAHASYLGGIMMWEDENRIEPIGNPLMLYAPCVEKVFQAVLSEANANSRTISQVDAIKIVIFDLDDTLWRGLAAELEDTRNPGEMIEGWPLGIVEAASYLWRRGILLAIVSKNDEAIAMRIWNMVYEPRFSIKNFVAIKINWASKASNIVEILKMVNLLPESALFVDDNPVERAAVQAALPGIRVMDVPLTLWRRILLWAPELQRAIITNEASQRTAMVHAQIERDMAHEVSNPVDFLESLRLTVRAIDVPGVEDDHFARCFELLNKTNQFNTTCRRWATAEIIQFFDAGGFILAFEIRDRFTNYGLTALMLITGNTIEQFVMSCRIFGLEVEKVCVAYAVNRIVSSGAPTVDGKIQTNRKNLLSADIFRQNGFNESSEGLWRSAPGLVLSTPSHITIVT
jgi:FkbH-like protein